MYNIYVQIIQATKEQHGTCQAIEERMMDSPHTLTFVFAFCCHFNKINKGNSFSAQTLTHKLKRSVYSSSRMPLNP